MRFKMSAILRCLVGLWAATALAAPGLAEAKAFTLYAGSYTSGASKGIYAWRLDSKTGGLTSLGLAAQTEQPAHVWVSPDARTLYAVNWVRPEGTVSAFRIDRASGKLTLLNRVSSKGALPNQVVVDPTGRIAVTVNFATGTMAAFKIQADGRLSEAFYQESYVGPPIAPKQTGPHTHGIQFSRDGRILWIAELGLDRLYSYRVDAAHLTITPQTPPYISTHAAAGPRRLQLSPNGRFLFVNHETDSEVSVFSVNGAALTEIQRASTLPAGVTLDNTTAEIVLDASGRHLYIGNRGHDSIAVFDVEPASGKIVLKANVPAGGRTPRNLRIDPTGRWLLSANENGGSITVFKINPSTGVLEPTRSAAQIDTPGGMVFVK